MMIKEMSKYNLDKFFENLFEWVDFFEFNDIYG